MLRKSAGRRPAGSPLAREAAGGAPSCGEGTLFYFLAVGGDSWGARSAVGRGEPRHVFSFTFGMFSCL